MSTFLNAYLLSVPLGYTITQMQNRFVGHLTDNGWQLLAQVDGLGGYSDLIPPATEAIGTSTFREVVRIYFPDNGTMRIGSYQTCIADAFPQSIRLTAKTAGAVQAGVTINGVTVLGAVGLSTSTANDNLKALYYALMDSVDATITGWTFSYNGSDTLICTAKVPAPMVACSGNANVNYYARGQSVLAGAQSDYARIDKSYAYSATVDLTNGFVYYMEVWSRSFSISTKCISGISGPIGASYIDHAEALAMTPPYSVCTPIELWVCEFGSNAHLGYGRVTHVWGILTAEVQVAIPNTGNVALPGYYVTDFNPWLGMGSPRMITDTPCSYGYTASNYSPGFWGPFTLARLGVDADDTLLDEFKVSPLGSTGDYIRGAQSSASVKWVPVNNLPDFKKWGGSEPNETVAMAQVNPVPTPSTYPTLAQALDATTAYASILLSSTAALPLAGGIIIGTEEFTYTGTSGGNTLTGVTRGADGTTQARHFIGDVVSPVTWFLKVNNGAVCCGANKPV